MSVVLAASLFLVHTLDGRTIYVNPEQVISLGAPGDHQLFTQGVRCIVTFSDGKFITVKEDCEAVRKLLDEAGDG